jgi:FAD:protein FMN transferase
MRSLESRESREGQFRRRDAWARAVIAGALALAAACGGTSGTGDVDGEAQIVARSGLAMGSELTLMAWTADQDSANRAFDAVFTEFDRLDGLMSTWKPDSDVSRLNAAAGRGTVEVSRDTMAALKAARDVGDLTGGKFDVTFGPLSEIWRFDHDQDNSVPDQAAIAARLPLVDYRRIVLDERGGTAVLQRPGMKVHLGGIGKGYAVDRGAAILREAGLRNFSIQAGGDLYVAGKRGDRAWRLGLAAPRAADGAVFARVELSDSTFSTSGDYERAFVKDGVRYHHILDPDTGQPCRLTRSVTIVAKTALLADGLSTGVFLLGPTEGMALVERMRDVEAVIVGADNQVHISSGLKGKVEILHPPTDGV